MFSEIRIQNFKSIHDLTLKPGRVTVLIGENGSGKSNILEGIAFAVAAALDKLDNEYLYNRGIRATEHIWMQSAFLELVNVKHDATSFSFKFNEHKAFDCVVSSSKNSATDPFPKWAKVLTFNPAIGDIAEKHLTKEFIVGAILKQFGVALGLKDEILKQIPTAELLKSVPDQSSFQGTN